MKIQYKAINLYSTTGKLIQQVNGIIEKFQAQGFDLTLRQLYYQLVAADIIPNKQTEYDRLGAAVVKGRLAGLIDWDAIVDRTRNVEIPPHWGTPADILDACVTSFATDKWVTQPCRVEVWIEKDALRGVIAGICRELDVPQFSCRGYTSVSEVWVAAQRHNEWTVHGQKVTVLHLADHDPSGLNMTDDLRSRLELFSTRPATVRRIALNMDQIRHFDPPPNPAKQTDSRYAAYVEEWGESCWELDALPPAELVRLIREKVTALRDEDLWLDALEQQGEYIAELASMARNWRKNKEGASHDYPE